MSRNSTTQLCSCSKTVTPWVLRWLIFLLSTAHVQASTSMLNTCPMHQPGLPPGALGLDVSPKRLLVTLNGRELDDSNILEFPLGSPLILDIASDSPMKELLIRWSRVDGSDATGDISGLPLTALCPAPATGLLLQADAQTLSATAIISVPRSLDGMLTITAMLEDGMWTFDVFVVSVVGRPEDAATTGGTSTQPTKPQKHKPSPLPTMKPSFAPIASSVLGSPRIPPNNSVPGDSSSKPKATDPPVSDFPSSQPSIAQRDTKIDRPTALTALRPTPAPSDFPSDFPSYIPSGGLPSSGPYDVLSHIPASSVTVVPLSDPPSSQPSGGLRSATTPHGQAIPSTPGPTSLSSTSFAPTSTDNPSDPSRAGSNTQTSVGLTLTPTQHPTASPSVRPTSGGLTEPPSVQPTVSPRLRPRNKQTSPPSKPPTTHPTPFPSTSPTSAPTSTPTGFPTPHPTGLPTSRPTDPPTARPTTMPTSRPTDPPTVTPTASPTPPPSPRSSRDDTLGSITASASISDASQYNYFSSWTVGMIRFASIVLGMGVFVLVALLAVLIYRITPEYQEQIQRERLREQQSVFTIHGSMDD